VTIGKLNTIVAAIVLACTGAFVFGLLLPGYKELERRREEFLSRQDDIRQKQKTLGDVSELYEKILALDAQMDDFRRRLPADRRFGEFLNDIAENLRRVGVTDYAVQPQPACDVDCTRLPPDMQLDENIALLPVSVSFESDFEQVFHFLKRMEDLARLSHVETISLINNDQNPGHVRVELVLHAYQQKLDDDTGGSDA